MNTTKDDNGFYSPEELVPIKQFLLLHKFRQTTPDVLTALSQLVLKYANNEVIVMNEAYGKLAPRGTISETFRAKLTYYVRKNFDDVQSCIKEKYGYDIGIDLGVRNFVEQLALVYSIFVMPL